MVQSLQLGTTGNADDQQSMRRLNRLPIIVAIVIIVYVVNWLYHRSSKEVSFVRTGFMGERVVINGGAFVLPFIHDYTPVNMNVLPMGIVRSPCGPVTCTTASSAARAAGSGRRFSASSDARAPRHGSGLIPVDRSSQGWGASG